MDEDIERLVIDDDMWPGLAVRRSVGPAADHWCLGSRGESETHANLDNLIITPEKLMTRTRIPAIYAIFLAYALRKNQWLAQGKKKTRSR